MEQNIGLGQAIALYVGAVLGAGVLVLPGQAASMAGPASLLSWLFMGLLGFPLAMTFAALATKFPDAGGIATFAARAFGPWSGGVAGWLYFVAGSVGQIIVPLTGGYYVAAALQIDQRFSYAVAAVILGVAVAANLAGLQLSANMQPALAGVVGLLLLAAALAAIPNVEPENFTPFAPAGIAGVGQAAVVLFFAFAGWEAVAHLAGEFRDVRRDLGRATVVTVVVVLTLYFGVALAVVATGAYGSAEMDRTAVGRVLGSGAGFSAATASGILATVICLGTTNAFIASVSRLGYALGRDGWLPAFAGRLSRRGVPAGGVWAVGGVAGAGLLLSGLRGWGTEDMVGVPATLVLVTYLVGTAAGIRLLAGRSRTYAISGFILTAAVAPFAVVYVAVPVVVAGAALLFRWVTHGRRRAGEPQLPSTRQ